MTATPPRSTTIKKIGDIEVLKLIHSTDDVTEHAATYRVQTPSGKKFDFTTGAPSRAWESKQKRALAWAELWRRTNGVTVTQNPSLVPISIAKEGKALIATYLFSIHALPSNSIADRLDLNPSTVKQYVNDVIQQRR